MNKNLPILIIGLVAIAAIVGGVVLYQNSQSTNATTAYTSNVSAPTAGNSSNGNSTTAPSPQSPADRMKNAPQGSSPAWAKGAPNAAVTLEEFADFQCPSCAFFQPVLKEIKTVYGDRVRIIFRQYPLAMHPKAFDASKAAEAAGMQGKFFEMHDLLFQKQKDWSLASVDHQKEFENYARQIGLNVEKYRSDIASPIAVQRITADKQRGDAVQIRATPSLFLNGRLLLPDEMEVTKLRQAIDNALAGK